MRIAVDATLIRPDRLTGVERYSLALVRGLAELAPGEIVLFRRPDAPEACLLDRRSSCCSMIKT